MWHLNIESYQSILEHGSADAGETSSIAVFLDFDPVLPGWPPDGDDEKVFDAVARAEASVLAERSIINANDLRRLTAMIRAARAPARAGCCVNALERRLQRATLVTPWEIPPDAVTMNSRVRVRDVEEPNEAEEFTIVYPRHDGSSQGECLCVLNPLGTELLGKRVGDVIHCSIGGRLRRFRVEGVPYQPEAAGDPLL